MDNAGVTTVTGRKKLCRAHAGDITLPAITKMAWGNGGVDESGQPITTTGNEIGLYNQLLVKDIESHEYNEDQTTCLYKATLEAGELDGEEISEMGLIDADGDLVVYRSFGRKFKDADIPQTYQISEIFRAK